MPLKRETVIIIEQAGYHHFTRIYNEALPHLVSVQNNPLSYRVWRSFNCLFRDRMPACFTVYMQYHFILQNTIIYLLLYVDNKKRYMSI